MKQLERRLIKLEAKAAASGHDGGHSQILTLHGIAREDLESLTNAELDALIAADDPYDEYKRIKGIASPERAGDTPGAPSG